MHSTAADPKKMSPKNNKQQPQQISDSLELNSSLAPLRGGAGAAAAGGRPQVAGSEPEAPRQHTPGARPASGKKQKYAPVAQFAYDQLDSPTGTQKKQAKVAAKRKAKLAKQESLEDYQPARASTPGCWRMTVNLLKRKRIFIPLVIASCIAAIYCFPFVELDPQSPKRVPKIPFNFREGPLAAGSDEGAGDGGPPALKVERLFEEQIKGAESVALDSSGNMYLAIEGGFILYAHLNKSSPLKRYYYLDPVSQAGGQAADDASSLLWHLETEDLVKIAELNGPKLRPFRRLAKTSPAHLDAASSGSSQDSSQLRECPLDEKLFGSPAFEGPAQPYEAANSIANSSPEAGSQQRPRRFVSHVRNSRCSVPLGMRLSPDESHLYVVDTLSGLYKVSLKVAERNSNQRLVTKLIDFRNNRRQLAQVIHLDQEPADQYGAPPPTHHLNVTLMAVDDLVIDYGAGTRGADMVYLSDGSQRWTAHGFLFDMLEGRPSGVILRYDTGSQQLSVLDPSHVAHVRHSNAYLLGGTYSPRIIYNPSASSEPAPPPHLHSMADRDLYMGVGAPLLNQDDLFDDRPLFFPNGLELTDDRQALLIADTINKRIIKHYIRGARKGTSDLWAWTPNFPDNIRRGFDRRYENYWVVGCGQDMSNKWDMLDWLVDWPRLREFMLRNVYLVGWMAEMLGTYVLRSSQLREWGYSFKYGHALVHDVCPGMMALQYNGHGDIIRAVHGRDFPKDLKYFSQANEVIDPDNQQHLLYLSSPAYNFVTKLYLPVQTSTTGPPP